MYVNAPMPEYSIKHDSQITVQVIATYTAC